MRSLLVLTLALLLLGCIQDSEEQNDVLKANGTANVVEINMTARQFEFEPSKITVKKGDLVRIYLQPKMLRTALVFLNSG
jgi:plastocyanin